MEQAAEATAATADHPGVLSEEYQRKYAEGVDLIYKLPEMDAALYVHRDAVVALRTEMATMRAHIEVSRAVALTCLQASPEARRILWSCKQEDFTSLMRLHGLDDYQTEVGVSRLMQIRQEIATTPYLSLPSKLSALVNSTLSQLEAVVYPSRWTWQTAGLFGVVGVCAFFLATSL